MVQDISPKELKELIASDAPLCLIDVRGADECARASIEGCRNLPIDDLPGCVADLPKDRLIVTVCHHGMRSKRAAEFLAANGFPNVKSLRGGVDLWAVEVDPTIGRY